ncbi:alpha/beta fold hydrolase [Pseudoalteromonas luteoviolacea]|uniref:alpha/beta fold hydrolase n=1 Tax=Pseudoalteromonas luteoviolacea TaxID=43657 RepID=UPI001B380026|nr:alpha/beta fold hydrolase [Pseudoalteromonas luteoviolacea]
MKRVKVYVIAGTMCNEKIWLAVKAHLGPNIELKHLVLPKNKSFDEMCVHLNKSIPEQKINLLGFSLGGYVAAYFSVLFPSKVSKLFIVSNSPTTLPETERQQRRQVLAFIERFGYSGLSPKMAKSLLDATSQQAELIELLQAMDRDQGVEELISQYTYTSQRSCLKARLRALQIPILFWFSHTDSLIDRQWFLTGIEGAFVNIIIEKGQGHMLPIEKPKTFARLIEEWLLKS